MQHFVILAVPRSGSNLLCTLLNSHPELLCHHEVFNPQGIFTARSRPKHPFDFGSMWDRDRDPLGFLQRVWQSGEDCAAVGFKWTRGQNEVVLNHVMQEPSIRKLVLRRRNGIKTFVSEQIARLTDQWELYDAAELRPRPQIEIDGDELRNHIAGNEAFYRRVLDQLTQDEQPFLELEYERLFDAHVHRTVLRFLEVEPDDVGLRASSVKQNPTDLRGLVKNFDELALSLQDEHLRAQLTDCGM
jgi:LPS sulfotransferase NodH